MIMRKLICAVLALCLACSMAACAGSNNSSSSASESSTSESSVVEESSSEAAEESSEAAEESSESGTEATVLSYDEYMAAELDSEVTIQAYVQAKQSWWEGQGHRVPAGSGRRLFRL